MYQITIHYIELEVRGAPTYMRVLLEGVNIIPQFILNASFSVCIIWLREVIELRVLNG